MGAEPFLVRLGYFLTKKIVWFPDSVVFFWTCISEPKKVRPQRKGSAPGVKDIFAKTCGNARTREEVSSIIYEHIHKKVIKLSG